MKQDSLEVGHPVQIFEVGRSLTFRFIFYTKINGRYVLLRSKEKLIWRTTLVVSLLETLIIIKEEIIHITPPQ